MKRLALSALLSLSSVALAQTLPDEINYPPYQARYQDLSNQTDASAARLQGHQSSLAQARRFISEMNAHIDDLQNAIAQDSQEISRLERLIPEVERRIQSLQSERQNRESDIRNQQAQEANLQNRQSQVMRDLQINEQELARAAGRLREMQSDLSRSERELRQAERELAQAQSQARRLDDQFEQERGEQRKLEQELAALGGRINTAQNELNNLQNALNGLQSSLQTENQKNAALERRVAEYQSQLNDLRSRNAPAEEITRAERLVNASEQALASSSLEIRNLEGQIRQNQQNAERVSAQIQNWQRDQQQIPSRISQSQARQQQIQSQRGQVQNEIQRADQIVRREAQELNRLEAIVRQQEQVVRNEEIQVQQIRNVAQDLNRQIENVRQIIANLANESRRLSNEIALASDQVRSMRAEIPQRQSTIRNNQNEIAQGERDITRAENDARSAEINIQKESQVLAQLTQNRNLARGEFDQRLSLYNRYLSEAKDLGSNQTANAPLLGEKEGARLATQFAKQIGDSAGVELGAAEAKLWGYVRGELQGYDQGHNRGNTAPDETSRAQAAAMQKAQADAEVFAQTNFKPVFFEEFVQVAFKKPVQAKSLKGLAVFNELSLVESVDSLTLDPLTPAELQASETLQTPLDSQIEAHKKSVAELKLKASRLSRPEVSYIAPTSIPLGAVTCTQVYKGLAVFKSACEANYKDVFTTNFLASSRKVFFSDYSGQFQDQFVESNVKKREAAFSSEFSVAFKVADAEGERVGRAENFQRSYAAQYKITYDVELPQARAKSKVDANNELTTFLITNPLLTLSESKLVASDFRGSETVSIDGLVKNIGQKNFAGAALIRVTAVENAEILEGEKVLQSASALAMTQIPNLKVKILPTAKAGQVLVVRGTIELPGDLFKPQRKESFELKQVLSANPANDLVNEYDATPSIKGVFNRYIHSFKTKITPNVEDVKEGYTLTLEAVGENAALIEIRDSKLETGALAVNTTKEGKFSYVFKDAAKNKVVMIKVNVSYLGKVIKSETIELRPH
ncbi:MAG: hypothetical protein K2P81_15070 [Bacteriovoracaceae bacterium]|nr:hypothetical protein [Bacteriovoracaceae bacterium]